jgi:antitoxin PrlF
VDLAATMTSKGQITVPKPVRVALKLQAGDRVLFRVHGDRAVLAKVPDFLGLAGSVPVPEGKRGEPWHRIRAEAWRTRARSK